MPTAAIGVDIGGSHMVAAAVGGGGFLSAHTALESSLGAEEEPVRVVGKLADLIMGVASHFARHEILGIGIGCPGPLDSKTGTILNTPNLPALRNFQLVQELKSRLGLKVPIFLENDANVAGAGEAFAGHGKGKKIVSIVTLGTGFGHALIIDGKIHSGAHGMAGEHAKSLVSPGCPSIEHYVSSSFISGKFCQETGLWKSAKEIDQIAHGIFDQDVLALHTRSTVNCQAIAEEAYAQFGAWLGYFLTFRINENDPDVFVLMGNLAKGHELFWSAMVKNLSLAQWPADLPFEEKDAKARELIKISELSQDAAIIGAASMVFANR